MWKALKDMAAQKKALVALLAALVWAGGKLGLQLDADELYPMVAPLWAYIIGQGIADHGKEAAKITADGGE